MSSAHSGPIAYCISFEVDDFASAAIHMLCHLTIPPALRMQAIATADAAGGGAATATALASAFASGGSSADAAAQAAATAYAQVGRLACGV